MDKKIVFIIAGVIIVLLGVGGIFLLNQKADTPASTASSDTASSSETTENEDLGLCAAVDTATVKSALGSAAASLSGPDNTGVTSLGDGDKGQTCVYPFAEGGSASNSFYTDLAVYSQESFDQISDFTATSGTAVSGVGDKATFKSGESLMGATEFTITAVKGTKVYLFVISQPEGAVTFDESSALTALTTIAQSAKL
jgi:hypothetical protein